MYAATVIPTDPGFYVTDHNDTAPFPGVYMLTGRGQWIWIYSETGWTSPQPIARPDIEFRNVKLTRLVPEVA